MTARPRLKDGRFVSTDCPVCGCGTLRQEEPEYWRCDGLRDPEDPNKELEACEYGIYFGEVVGLPSNVELTGAAPSFGAASSERSERGRAQG